MGIIDIEDLKEYEDFVNNLKKRELEKVKNKFPNYEFIDEDEE